MWIKEPNKNEYRPEEKKKCFKKKVESRLGSLIECLTDLIQIDWIGMEVARLEKLGENISLNNSVTHQL